MQMSGTKTRLVVTDLQNMYNIKYKNSAEKRSRTVLGPLSR